VPVELPVTFQHGRPETSAFERNREGFWCWLKFGKLWLKVGWESTLFSRGLIGDELLNLFLAVTVSAGTELDRAGAMSLFAPAPQCGQADPKLSGYFFRSQELRHLIFADSGSS
jgi:hypothetical protein